MHALKLAISFLFLSFASNAAFAIAMSYDIGSYKKDGFTASAMHKATSCRGSGGGDVNSDGLKDFLYMCGGTPDKIGGQLQGEWDGTMLTGITGEIAGHAVIGGSLGGSFYSADEKPLWYLTLEVLGTFYFEQLAINQVTGEHLILWGQNDTTYYCTDSECREREGKGMDLYGKGHEIALPEPGMASVLFAGLLGAGAAYRRRRAESSGNA